MYGLSSRQSMAKLQTGWVKKVEETAKTITLKELEEQKQPHTELVKQVTALEERIAQMESRIVELEKQVDAWKTPAE